MFNKMRKSVTLLYSIPCDIPCDMELATITIESLRHFMASPITTLVIFSYPIRHCMQARQIISNNKIKLPFDVVFHYKMTT
jgi:hypothetical protein